MGDTEEFFWQRRPEIESLFLFYLDRFSESNSVLSDWKRKLHQQTSSGMLDWIDHMRVPDSSGFRKDLYDLGFEQETSTNAAVFRHPGVLLPSVILVGSDGSQTQGVALRVDSIDDFSRANNPGLDIEGPRFSPFRRALLAVENRVGMWVVERRGIRGAEPVYPEDSYLQDYAEGRAAWAGLAREEEDEEKAWLERFRAAGSIVSRLGSGPAAYIVCQCEREYWLSRNAVGQVQKKRQDAIGVGWGNQDHHTFRSSRRNFQKLIRLFSELGFHKRERFYAGDEAGWGAQVMEHPTAGMSLFLDVDLTPDEVDIDFSTRELEELNSLGTVGLWCALHGDSILQAGMHHLAARFEFLRLREDLAKEGIRFMPPFSNFPYLKQAFSLAETWQVSPSRIRSLLQEKRIDEKQADKFLGQGTVGSHLENIERREGYKGFNKKNVSAIIRDTDPRRG